MTSLVETCAGSAALSRRLLGLGKLVGYMGGKDGYADAILDAWRPPAPTDLVLNDPGLWGLVWSGLTDTGLATAAAAVVEAWAELDPRAVFDLSKEVRQDDHPTARSVAGALCRFAGTYGGGETGGFKGRHKLRPNVDGFIPNRLTIARRLAAFRWPVPVSASRCSARTLSFQVGSWVYVDPPYSGVSGYLNDLPRAEVVAVCLSAAAAGANVAVSEHEAIPELVAAGWSSRRLTKDRKGQSRKNSRSREEWLTWLRH